MQQLAPAVDHVHTKHVVPRRPDCGPGRAREARRHHAAHRCARAKMRRLESQHLSVLRQHLLEHGQRRARAHGNDQLTRFVRDDSVQAPRVENVARERLAIKILGAAATNAQWPALCSSGTHLVNDGGEGNIHGGHGKQLVSAPV